MPLPTETTNVSDWAELSLQHYIDTKRAEPTMCVGEANSLQPTYGSLPRQKPSKLQVMLLDDAITTVEGLLEKSAKISNVTAAAFDQAISEGNEAIRELTAPTIDQLTPRQKRDRSRERDRERRQKRFKVDTSNGKIDANMEKSGFIYYIVIFL
jgi:hypothetical protein